MVERAAGIEGSLVGGRASVGRGGISAIVASTQKSGLTHPILRIHSRQIYCASLSLDTSLAPLYLRLASAEPNTRQFLTSSACNVASHASAVTCESVMYDQAQLSTTRRDPLNKPGRGLA
jgi:hypothetical protein